MIPGTLEAGSYSELIAAVQPRLITKDVEATRIQNTIDVLIDKGPESEDEIQLLRLLGGLIRLWEDGRYTLPDITGPEAVRTLLRERGMKQGDLVGPVFSTPSVASEVLTGKRRLSLDTIQKLARFFHVPPAVFIEDETRRYTDEPHQDSEHYTAEETSDRVTKTGRTVKEAAITDYVMPQEDEETAWHRVQAAASELVSALRQLDDQRLKRS